MEDDDDYLPDFLKEDSVVESPFGLDDMVMPSDYKWTYLNDDYSVEGIKKARLGSLFIKLTGNQRRTLDKIRAKLYNWDSEPSYSDIFHKEFCKTEGVSLSVLKTLEKKGLIKLSKGDEYYFKERGYIVYPKPMMYAFYITEEDDYPDWFIPEAKEKGLWKAESFEAEFDFIHCSNCLFSKTGLNRCEVCNTEFVCRSQHGEDCNCYLFTAESKKMNPLEKAGISGMASGATMEGLETLLAAEIDKNYYYVYNQTSAGKETGNIEFTYEPTIGNWTPIDDPDFDSYYREDKEYELVDEMLRDENSRLFKFYANNPFHGEDEFQTNYKVRDEEGNVENLSFDISWSEPTNVDRRRKYYDFDTPLHRLSFQHLDAEEEELSEEKLSAYFARLESQKPDLAREIEYSVKNEDELPTQKIYDAGFNPSIIEEWVDLVGVEDENLQPYESCSTCEGEGYVLTSYTSATRFDPADGDGEDCEECGGTGMIDPSDYMDKEGQYYAETFEAEEVDKETRELLTSLMVDFANEITGAEFLPKSKKGPSSPLQYALRDEKEWKEGWMVGVEAGPRLNGRDMRISDVKFYGSTKLDENDSIYFTLSDLRDGLAYTTNYEYDKEGVGRPYMDLEQWCKDKIRKEADNLRRKYKLSNVEIEWIDEEYDGEYGEFYIQIKKKEMNAESLDDMKIKYDNRDRIFFIKSVDYDTDGEIENDELPQEFTIKIPSDYHYFDEDADEGDITDVLNEWISTETGFSTKGIVWIEEENNSWRKNAESFEAAEWVGFCPECNKWRTKEMSVKIDSKINTTGWSIPDKLLGKRLCKKSQRFGKIRQSGDTFTGYGSRGFDDSYCGTPLTKVKSKYKAEAEETKSITPYLLGVGIVGILGYAFTRKLY